jgi:integrase
MAYLRHLPSGKWSAQVEKMGVRTSRSFRTKAQAQAWATEVEAEVMASRRGQIVRRTLRQALERYGAEVAPTKGSARRDGHRLPFLAESLGFADKWLEDITADDFGRWRDRQLLGVKGSTVNRDLNLLTAVLSTARDEWGWLVKSPLTRFRRPKNPPPRRRVIAWHEAKAVLRALGWRKAPPTTLQQEAGFAFLMSLHTGMRAGEVLSYRLQGKVAHLEKTKNGHPRDVPLGGRALKLHALCPGYTITGASLDALFRKARVKAGLSGFTFHDARRTALTRLSSKLSPLQLARVSGHRDLRVLLQVYYAEKAQDIGAGLR